MNSKPLLGIKKQNLALDGRKYEVAWHPQTRRGQPLPRNISQSLAADSRLGMFLIHYGWLQGLPLLD